MKCFKVPPFRRRSPKSVSTAQLATELYHITASRQEAEDEHRPRIAELYDLTRSLLSSIGAAGLDDPDLRAVVAILSDNATARVLLNDWPQRVRGGEFDPSLYRVPVPVRADDGAPGALVPAWAPEFLEHTDDHAEPTEWSVLGRRS